jgi:hypothetical protein
MVCICRPVALNVAIMFNLSIYVVQVQNIVTINSPGYLEQVHSYFREYLLLAEMKKFQHCAYEIMTETLLQQQSRYIFNLN